MSLKDTSRPFLYEEPRELHMEFKERWEKFFNRFGIHDSLSKDEAIQFLREWQKPD